jgi:hypothetical protein
MQPERALATQRLAAATADVLAIIAHEAVQGYPRAAQLWVALYALAGFRAGTIQADDHDMAAMLKLTTRALRASKGTPGAIELLESCGAIQRHGRSVDVASPFDVGGPRRARPPDAPRPLAGMPADLDAELPPPATALPRVLRIERGDVRTGGVGAKSPTQNSVGERGNSPSAAADGELPRPFSHGDAGDFAPSSPPPDLREQIIMEGKRRKVTPVQINQVLSERGFAPKDLLHVPPPRPTASKWQINLEVNRSCSFDPYRFKGND